MTHPDTLQIPRAVVEQAIAFLSSSIDFRTVESSELRRDLRAALQPQACVSKPAESDAQDSLFVKDGGLRAAAEQHAFNDESPFCVKCGSTGEAEADPVAHILPRMLKILKFKTMPVPVDPLPYDNGEEKTVPLYTTPPATQAALTAALDALKFAYNDCESDFVRDEKIDPAIAQIEALKGPTP